MPILTATEARALVSRGGTPLDDPPYTDEWVDDVIAAYEAEFTRYRGDHPVATTTTETVRAVGVSDRLALTYPYVTAITSATVNSVLVPAADYHIGPNGYIVRSSGVFTDTLPATVVYVHGWASPDDLKRACAKYVEKSAAADRAGSSRDVRWAGEQPTYVLPDWDKNKPTGWTDVDRIWNGYPDLRQPAIW